MNHEEKYQKFIDEATVNLSQHDYDCFIESTIRQMKTAGIKSFIVRRQLADCCEYCAKLAGTYEYAPGKYPDDIFSRHENCKCLVTVKSEKGGYTNAWNKKEYSTQREARIEREQEISLQNGLFSEYLKKRNQARDRGDLYFDATDYWSNKSKEFPARTRTEKGAFIFHGEDYSNEKNAIVWEPGEKEREFAEWWCERYGGEITYIPRVINPEHVRTPDYSFGNEYYELKQPKGIGKNTIEHQVLSDWGDGNIQAENLIIDLSYTELKNDIEKVGAQIEWILKDEKYSWLKKLIITSDGAVKMAFEKT